jgi:hypothetical protein
VQVAQPQKKLLSGLINLPTQPPHLVQATAYNTNFVFWERVYSEEKVCANAQAFLKTNSQSYKIVQGAI